MSAYYIIMPQSISLYGDVSILHNNAQSPSLFGNVIILHIYAPESLFIWECQHIT